MLLIWGNQENNKRSSYRIRYWIRKKAALWYIIRKDRKEEKRKRKGKEGRRKKELEEKGKCVVGNFI